MLRGAARRPLMPPLLWRGCGQQMGKHDVRKRPSTTNAANARTLRISWPPTRTVVDQRSTERICKTLPARRGSVSARGVSSDLTQRERGTQQAEVVGWTRVPTTSSGWSPRSPRQSAKPTIRPTKPRTAKVIAPTPVCSFHRGLRGCTGTEHRVSIVRRIPLVIACAGLGGEACPVVCWSS